MSRKTFKFVSPCVIHTVYSIICNWAVVLISWAAKVARTGLGEGGGKGLLLLAACTEGPLLLVQQARLRMSQPA